MKRWIERRLVRMAERHLGKPLSEATWDDVERLKRRGPTWRRSLLELLAMVLIVFLAILAMSVVNQLRSP
jgi:hypothetical protein